MPDHDSPPAAIPESRIVAEKKGRLSMVWIIPIAAAAVGAWIAVTTILGAGPKITIVFKSAEGLEAGKTKVQFNGVEIGTLTAIRLADDPSHVIATAQMAPKTDAFLVGDTKFWVVRPRITGATVSGLGTLISGAYVGMEIGKSAVAKRSFDALDTPPVVTADAAGRFFVLKTPDLGSLDNGTPLYFRRLQVGEVTGYELDRDGRSLTVKAFVRAPYDQYVTADTRFWQASGIDVSLSANGMSVQTQSFLSLLIGGIAFETPATGPLLPEADANAAFQLFGHRATAFEPPAMDPQTFVLVFTQSVRGLAPGAPVEFHGIPIGEVGEIRAQFDMETGEFSVPVIIHIDASKLGVKVFNIRPGETLDAAHHRVLEKLVAEGLRAQLKTANLLTGSMLVAADFFPEAPPVTLDWSQSPVQFPTAPGGFEAIEASLSRVLHKLDALPLEAIGDDLRKAIAELDQMLASAHRTVDNVDDLVVNKFGKLPYATIGDDLTKAIADFSLTLVSARSAVDGLDAMLQPNSALGSGLNDTLQEVARAAKDLGVLLDYLERHPEALIRGKSGE